MKPMNPVFAKLIGSATRLVHKGALADATAQLQQLLRNTMGGHHPSHVPTAKEGEVLDGHVREVDERPAPTASPSDRAGGFTDHTFGDGRRYKLFIPTGFEGQRLPLLLMLHGCTQDPDDFAAGTRMNELAQSQGVIVVYPAQPQRSNAHKCWNWFQPGDQHRDRGEPAVLAGIVRQVMSRGLVDSERVYVAGLSAGGAMAAILGREYPEIFAATGVHSGLPQGAAHDVASAFAAMQGRQAGPSPLAPSWKAPGAASAARVDGFETPTIVFHGDADVTVHPGNGEKVVRAALTSGASMPTEVVRGEAAGRAFTRSVFTDTTGRPCAEHWVVHGAGHAWSGGSAQGSYADAQGPDASKEMLRFFLSHRRQAA